MLKAMHVRFSVSAICVIVLFLAGCATISKQSVRFYVLGPIDGTETGIKNVSQEAKGASIGIGPVSLPKYLRKSQIVTRTGNNELQLAEFDRWAGKIEEDIGRVIAENLAIMLANEKVVSYPAVSASDTDYRIELDISRFEGTLGESVELVARWVINNRQRENVMSITSSRIREQVRGDGYSDMVAAQSLALASLSRELADAIIKLSER